MFKDTIPIGIVHGIHLVPLGGRELYPDGPFPQRD